MKHLKIFENWCDSEKLKSFNDITGIYTNENETVTTIDKLMSWYGGKNWSEDEDVATNLEVETEDDDIADPMDHLKYLENNKNNNIVVKCEKSLNSYELTFSINDKTYTLHSIKEFK